SFVFLLFAFLAVSEGMAVGESPPTLRGHTGWISSLAFTPDGKLLASASADKTVKLWAIPDGRELATLQGHEDYVSSVAMSPDGKVMATGSFDKSAKLWDLATAKGIASLRGHS